MGKPAAGGACVAHLNDGRVAFVRHSIPGERVLARITEEARSFVRADAITILDRASARVHPPCRHSGPGGCGGCDFQHVAPRLQREIKAALVTEQLRRLADLDWELTVEAVPGDENGLAWRTRARYAVLPQGRLGFRRYRSHEVHLVDSCPIAGPAIRRLAPEKMSWRGAAEVEVFAPLAGGELTVSVESQRGRRPQVPRFDGGLVIDGRVVREPSELQLTVGGNRFVVGGGVFWQIHVGAPRVLGDALCSAADLQAGESAADADRRALDKVRAFLEVLADSEAVCTVQFGESIVSFTDVGQVRTSIQRLSQENLREEPEELPGELQGVLPKARVFEFKLADSSQVVRGKISPTVGDPDALNRELHRQTVIKVMVTRVGSGRPRYVLLEVPASP